MTDAVQPRESEPARSPTTDYETRRDLPVYACERCGRPFASQQLLALHRGIAHPGDLDEAEADAFRDAHADEEARLRRFRLEALGALVALYFGLLLTYAAVELF